jgi:hypothetical protein
MTENFSSVLVPYGGHSPPKFGDTPHHIPMGWEYCNSMVHHWNTTGYNWNTPGYSLHWLPGQPSWEHLNTTVTTGTPLGNSPGETY